MAMNIDPGQSRPTVDSAQQEFERKVGDGFVAWINAKRGTNFAYTGRPGKAPDLIYSDRAETTTLEVTSAWYDSNDAKFWWQNLRSAPNAPKGWSGAEMDAALIDDISNRIERKCQNRYGKSCLLVVYVHPTLTSADEVTSLIDQIHIPDSPPFAGIYLAGHFYMGSVGSNDAYRVWRLA